MFDTYFKLQDSQNNDDDLINLLFKQLIIEAFTDNEIPFNQILKSLKEKDISLFNSLTIYPQYTGFTNNNEVQIERGDSDYASFVSACAYFIKNEKYLIKIIQHLSKEILDGSDYQQDALTSFTISLLDNNQKSAFKEIITSELLSEKEIKLKLILPENLANYQYRKIHFHTLELEFLSDNLHDLKITKKNMHKVLEIYADTLANANSQQYKKLVNILLYKIDFSIFDDHTKKEIFKKLLEFGVIGENQIVGTTTLLKEPSIEIKSFLNLSVSVLETTKNLQNQHLERRLNMYSNEPLKDKINKI